MAWSGNRVKRLVVAVFAAIVLSAVAVSGAAAHGEISQEPFLRAGTIAFTDVTFSTDRVDQGQALTITGKFKILETWPRELQPPETAYLSITVPGPVFVVTERKIGGQLTPMSFYIEKGKVYDFSITVVGRTPGTYHVHPAVYVEGSGPLLGPGQWVTVSPAPGGFQMPVKLLDGTVIPDLQTYRQWFIVGFSVLTFLLGLAWMIYWTVPKPTVTRLAVTNVIPSADWGSDFGLITRRDVRNVGIIALLAVVALVGGWIYMQTTYPNIIPLQVHRIQGQPLEIPSLPVKLQATEAVYDQTTKQLTVTIQVTNNGNQPVTVDRMLVSNREFLASAPERLQPWQSQLTAEGNLTLQPGESRSLRLTVAGDFLETERLLPTKQTPYMVFTATFMVRDAAGTANYLTSEAPLRFASY